MRIQVTVLKVDDYILALGDGLASGINRENVYKIFTVPK